MQRTLPRNLGGQRGFTLIETLVSLIIVALVSLMMMQSLVKTSSRLSLEAEDRIMQNAARLAISRLAKELQGIGLDTRLTPDPNQTQPKMIYAGPYQMVFNGDLDSTVADPALRRGQIKVEGGDWAFETVGDPNGLTLYAPVADYTDPNSPDFVNGAETIRIGLDVNFDGLIEDDVDSENAFWTTEALWADLDLSRFMSPNPKDHVVMREAYGWDEALGDNRRSWEVLAFGVRPWLDDSYAYPTDLPSDKRIPPPLFQYWGYFCNDGGSPAVPLECLFADADDPSDDGWGVLSADEMEAWVNAEVAGGKYEEGPTLPDDDTNADGVSNRSMDEVLTKIVITLNLEAPMYGKNANLRRSDGLLGPTGAPSLPYYYKDVTLLQTVVPVNIRLRGTNAVGL